MENAYSTKKFICIFITFMVFFSSSEIDLNEDNIESRIIITTNGMKKRFKEYQIKLNKIEVNNEIQLNFSRRIHVKMTFTLIPHENKTNTCSSNSSPISSQDEEKSIPVLPKRFVPVILPPRLKKKKEPSKKEQNSTQKSIQNQTESFNTETISNDKSTTHTSNNYQINVEYINNYPYEIMISEQNIDVNEEPNDTLMNCFLIIGLNNKNIKLLSDSNVYPSMCNHKECSILSAFEPNVIECYKNYTCPLKINELTAQMCFPNGIKLCYFADEINKNNIAKPYSTFTNVIQIETGELFYIVTAFVYIKMSIYEFESIYKTNPLRGYVKFEDFAPNSNSGIPNKYSDKEISQLINMVSSLFIKEEILIPHAICLISKYPYISQMDKTLQGIIEIQNEDITLKIINQLINQVPIPDKNQKIMYYLPNNEIPLYFASNKNYPSNHLYQTNLSKIFLNISTRKIILIFHLLLCERQLLFIDEDFQNLSNTSLSFIHFLYPLTWAHTYTPILSYTTMRFLQSIFPYVMGINEVLFNEAIKRQYIESDNNGIIFIHLKKKYLSYELSLKKCSKSSIIKHLKLQELPENVYEFLEKQIHLIKKEIQNISEIENDISFNQKIQKIFLTAMILILGEYKNHIFFTDEEMPYFNVDSFIETKPKRDRPFYSEFLSTQLFAQFLYNEKLILLTKKQKVMNNNNKGKISKYFIDTSYFNEKLKKWEEETYNNLYLNNNKKNNNRAIRAYSLKKLTQKNKNKSPNQMRNHSNQLNISNNSINQTHQDQIKFNNNLPKQYNLSLFRNDSMASIEKCNEGNNQHKRTSGVIDLIVPPFFISEKNIRINKDLIENYIKKHKHEYGNLKLKQNVIINYIRDKPFTFEHIKTKSINKYYKPPVSALLHYKNIVKNKYKNVNVLTSFYLNKSNNEIISQQSESKNVQSNKKLVKETSMIPQRNDNNKNNMEEIKKTIDKWYIDIVSPDKKDKSFKIKDISSFLTRSECRDMFTLLLTQTSILDDSTNKMLSVSNFDNMLKAIKIALFHLHPTEYKNCKLLTLALFSYYKVTEKNGCIFLFEELFPSEQDQQPEICKLWRSEDMWIKWYTEDLNEKQKEEEENLGMSEFCDDEYNEEDNKNSSISAKRLLFRMENIMKDLLIDTEFIQNIILCKLASKYLNYDDFLEIESNV